MPLELIQDDQVGRMRVGWVLLLRAKTGPPVDFKLGQSSSNGIADDLLASQLVALEPRFMTQVFLHDSGPQLYATVGVFYR